MKINKKITRNYDYNNNELSAIMDSDLLKP